MRIDTDIVIAGGGPAGLIAAIAARRKGFRVMVADPCGPPNDKACGEGLMPEALAVAARLGVEFPAGAGFPFRGIRFIGQRDSVEAGFHEGAGLAIRRTALHSLLARHAEEAGVELLWGSAATALQGEGVVIGGRQIRTRWAVGADGGRSRVRRWAGLEQLHRDQTRFGFRRHYAIEPWSSHVEIYWGEGCQVYITPVSQKEVGVAVLTRDSHQRVGEAVAHFPELARRLAGSAPTSRERGGCSSTRRLRRVTAGGAALIGVALIGDASGSVDAITGDGISLAFQQAEALAAAFEADDLALYETAHRRIARQPAYMGEILLMLDRHPRLRERALRALASKPALFADLLALHTGPREMRMSPMELARTGLALSWRLVTA